MKKLFIILVLIGIVSMGFTYEKTQSETFNLLDLEDYQKQFVGEEIEVCSSSSSKTYMSYRAVTSPSSKQYWFIKDYMTVDESTGLLYDCDGFIGVALGSYFGDIGDRFYFTLDSGIVLPVVMIDEKDDAHTINGCQHLGDDSVIEFVIDPIIASEYFGKASNGYILQGNFNNYALFHGEIAMVEKVTEEVNKDYVSYFEKNISEDLSEDIFQYASGY